MQVFLSHSSVDKDLARRLGGDLQAAGIEVWLDQWQIAVGERFEQAIEQGLGTSDFVVVLLSQRSVANDWVDREWRSQFEEELKTKQIKVIPVRCEPCQMPDFLAQRSHADISGGSYQLGFQHLLNLLRYHADQAQAGPDLNIAAYRLLLAHYLELERQMFGLDEPAESLQIMLPVTAPIGIELSRELIPLAERTDSSGNNRLLDTLIPALRETLYVEFGFVFPGVKVRGNETDMPPCSALILIDEIPELMFELNPDELVVEEAVERLNSNGIAAEPRSAVFSGRNRAAIGLDCRAAAEAAGLRVWEADEYLCQVLYTIVSRSATEFLDIDVVRRLVESQPDLTLPEALSWFDLTAVLQELTSEHVGVGDIRNLLGALADADPSLNIQELADLARQGLRAQICARLLNGRGELPVLRVSSEIEQLLREAMQETSQGIYLHLAPEKARQIVTAIMRTANRTEWTGARMVLLVSSACVRPYLWRLIESNLPESRVISIDDLAPDLPVRVVAEIDMTSDADNVSLAGVAK